jgi:hypothetical protein
MRHKDDFSVQERGCGALRNLAMAHPDDKKGLAMTGAARVVAAASEKLWGRSDSKKKEVNKLRLCFRR